MMSEHSGANGAQPPVLTLIHGGELYGPEPLGQQSVLCVGDTIARIGSVARQALETLDLPMAVIDATGCLVVPGLIDPHQHLIGAGGEQGFGSRTPELSVQEIACAGVTTVIGCLGTDTTTRHLTSLLAKAHQLEAQGITAWIYTGGFWLPPQTITGSVMDDLILIDRVIGVGEIAIADARSAEPTCDELARLVSQAIVGGSIGGKAGVAHFHVGGGTQRLSLLNALLDEHEIPPRQLYPTHISRSDELMNEAIALARRGAFVDLDTVDDDLPQRLGYYHAHGGDLRRLTISSDAHTPGGSPGKLFRNLVRVLRAGMLPPADVLALSTRNPATALGLHRKGRLAAGADADLLVLRADSLEVVHVLARGRQIVTDGPYVDQPPEKAGS